MTDINVHVLKEMISESTLVLKKNILSCLFLALFKQITINITRTPSSSIAPNERTHASV